MGLNIKNICNQSQIKQINTWMDEFQKGKTKPLFIYGKAGSGKSILSNLIFTKYNYTIIDYTKLYINNHKNVVESLKSIMGIKSITMMFEQRITYKGLIIDDIDHYIEYDKNIFTAVENIIKNIKKYPKNPLILIAGKLNKKHLAQFENQCICIKLKQTYNKIKEITINELSLYDISLENNDIDILIKSCGNNLSTIKEKIKFLKNKPDKNHMQPEPCDNHNHELISQNIDTTFNNEILLYIKQLFNMTFDKNTIHDIYINVYSDINLIILSLLENSVKYLHNCTLKHYKKSIKSICLLYDNIVLSDYYEYINVQNHTYDLNYIILHGIIFPTYYIYINNFTNKKLQFNYKDTTIYSKSIIEIYNNKKKIHIESLSEKLNNMDNFIKIYYNGISSANCEVIVWCEYIIKNDVILKEDLIKYIKYILSKCFNYKLKNKKTKSVIGQLI